MASAFSAQQTTEHLFRQESGKMLSVLIKLFGLTQAETAEDIVQETLLSAYETWKLKGLPDNPRAWLYRVAKNKTIDYLRRERNFQAKIVPQLAQQAHREATSDQWLDPFFAETAIEDAQLRMMFACCHPAIPTESQLALMLRTLCGLRTVEIAAAFLLPEETIGKRLYRAREKLRAENISLELPIATQLSSRLDAVLQGIYLLFNEGYKSASEATVIRRDLCEEALRLGDLLARSQTGNVARTHALQALMCFHASRFDARLDTEGGIILLEKQDRSRWNQALIALGYQHLRLSESGTEISDYHVEAAIASYHTSAPTFEKTNWKAIYYCYNLLLNIHPTPTVALNRAIALGFAEGAQAGIEALLKLEDLSVNYLYWAALGDFYVKNQTNAPAKDAYSKAFALATLPAEKKVIAGKLAALQKP